MAIQMTASDGTVFRVFNQGRGDYIATVDDQGFHYAPSQYATLPNWTERQARQALHAAIDDYEQSLREAAY